MALWQDFHFLFEVLFALNNHCFCNEREREIGGEREMENRDKRDGIRGVGNRPAWFQKP